MLKNKIFLISLLFIVSISLFAQPSNDDCANAISITVGAGCTMGDVTSATTEGLSTPSCWNGPPSNYSTSVWYSFVATSDSISVNFGDGTLGTNVLMVAYSGTCGSLTEIGCTKGGEIELIGLDETTPQTYYVMVDGQGANEGTFCISTYITPPPPPPIGTCENPRDMQVASDCNNIGGTQYDGQNNIISTDLATGGDGGADATGYGNPENLESGCGGTSTSADAYWVRFEATASSQTFNNGGGDALDYAVYSGADCSSLTEVSCTTINGGGSTTISGLSAGTVYYVMITSTATTQRYLCITSSTEYTNPYDNCSNALAISANSLYNLNNANSSDDGGVGDLCSGSVENSIWIKWTTPATWTGDAYVHLYNQDCACENGLQMAIHTASTSCPGNSPTCEVSLNPNNNNDFFGQFTPTAGSTYYIAIDGYAECVCDFDFSITNSSTTPVLSLKLLSFELSNKSDYNEINWQTKNEDNVQSIVVQRSKDGIEFEDINRQKAKGGLDIKVDYSYRDYSPYHGTNFYRLKEVTYDGVITYSSVKSIASTKYSFNSFKMYPNPSQGENVIIHFDIESKASSSIEVYDMMGKLYVKKEVGLSKGGNNVNLEIEGFEKGMYFVMMNVNNEIYRSQLIID